MSFKVEQKGTQFLVLNGSTGDVRGRFKTEGEAKVHQERLQKEHNDGIEQVSARTTPTQ